METLTGKTAIISGGGTGIGRAIARTLSREGVRVVVCGRRLEPIQMVEQEIEADGGRALAIQADVAVESDVEKLVTTAKKAFGTVEILISNAGIDGGAPIHVHNVEDWDKVLAVNLRGPFLLARAVLPQMRENRRGHLIQISSESGLEYYPGDGAYGISKHALNALGEYIQVENQEFGIRVDTICPGMVVTEMTENSPGLDHGKCLTPEDIADLALWLLTRRQNIKIGRPILIQTMENPWR